MIADDSDILDHSENALHLRRGKWTIEEENYANKIISLFNQGKLAILPGTTLRSLLSEKLQCDPMRITKKYAGKSCIGKQIYQPSEGFQDDVEAIQEAERELEVFEKIFLNKIQAKAAAAMMHSPMNRSRSPSQRILQKQSSTESTEAEIPLKASQLSSDGGKSLRSPPAVRKIGFSKRNLSAPNLSRLEKPFSFSHPQTSSLQSIKEEAEERENEKEKRMKLTEEFFLLGGRVPLQEPSASSSFTAKKRSHSVMALMDFEKLVADDRAAGDLFYEFVTMIGGVNGSNKKHNRATSKANQVPRRRSLSGEATVLLDEEDRGHVMRMVEEEESSSFHSRETMVHQYHQPSHHREEEDGDEGRMVEVVVQHTQTSPHTSSSLSEETDDHDCDNFF